MRARQMVAGGLICALLVACSGSGSSESPPPAQPPLNPACGAGIKPEPGLVVTDFGAVRGTLAGAMHAFLGVPYAAAPLGALRWQPPQDPACWDGERAATAFAPGCIQKRTDQTGAPPVVAGSEDCLYLNVWTPAGYAGQALPVLVFIHGGGNQQGAANQVTAGAALYDGAKLAARGDAVVVTIDYRLGPLGFLTLPALADAAGHYGNWGLLDQIHALNWVRRHIARFGGDPARVLLFGESAGAVDVCMLLASPLADGLFARAVMQSGACTTKPRAQREQDAADYAAAVGCDQAADVAACLMALDATALVAPLGGLMDTGVVTQAFGPSVDGWVLPREPMTALAEGTSNRVPLIIGSNAEETAFAVAPGTVNRAMVLALFSTFPEPARSALLALYDPGPGVSLTQPSSAAREAYIRATTDAQFTCQARRIARAILNSPGATSPVYRYFFTHRLSGAAGTAYGAYHGLELFYLFQTLEDSSYAADMTPADSAVEATMLELWTGFAASGTPNGGALSWPVYADHDPYLELAATPLAGAGLRTAQCDAWDAVAALP